MEAPQERLVRFCGIQDKLTPSRRGVLDIQNGVIYQVSSSHDHSRILPLQTIPISEFFDVKEGEDPLNYINAHYHLFCYGTQESKSDIRRRAAIMAMLAEGDVCAWLLCGHLKENNSEDEKELPRWMRYTILSSLAYRLKKKRETCRVVL